MEYLALSGATSTSGEKTTPLVTVLRAKLIGYSFAGKVDVLPARYANSASAFHGKYDEAGSVVGIAEGFELLKSWLLDNKEVDGMSCPNDLSGEMALASIGCLSFQRRKAIT